MRTQKQEQKKKPGCHCRGERLLIILGHRNDATIRATKEWALGLRNAGKRVWFSAAPNSSPAFDVPRVPNSTNDDWPHYKRPSGANGSTTDYAKTFDDFCFFEEVMVMSHGSTPRGAQFIKCLAQLAGGRPIRKLTLWICELSRDLYPNNSSNSKEFEKLAGLIVPKTCPCACDLALCSAKAINPDGKHPSGYACPGPKEATKMYVAGWYAHPRGSGTWTLPSKLGIDLGPGNGGQPLTSPDGTVREVTVHPNKSITTRVVTSPTVFNGFRVKTDTGLYETNPQSSDRITPARRLQESTAEVTAEAYTGPTACPSKDGCLRD